jgi:hypothetical protein
MKIKSKIALVIAVVALLFLVGWTSRAEQPPTDWEYKTLSVWQHVDVSQPNLKQFNDMGDEGWELVQVISMGPVRNDNNQLKLTCYFKRPR